MNAHIVHLVLYGHVCTYVRTYIHTYILYVCTVHINAGQNRSCTRTYVNSLCHKIVPPNSQYWDKYGHCGSTTDICSATDLLIVLMRYVCTYIYRYTQSYNTGYCFHHPYLQLVVLFIHSLSHNSFQQRKGTSPEYMQCMYSQQLITVVLLA